MISIKIVPMLTIVNDDELLRLAHERRVDIYYDDLRCRMPATVEQAEEIIAQRTIKRIERDREDSEICLIADRLTAALDKNDSIGQMAIEKLTQETLETKDEKLRQKNSSI